MFMAVRKLNKRIKRQRNTVVCQLALREIKTRGLIDEISVRKDVSFRTVLRREGCGSRWG